MKKNLLFKSIPISLMLLIIAGFSLYAQPTVDNWTVGTSAVTYEQETTTVNEGANSLKVTWTSSSNQDINSDVFAVTPGATYNFSIDVYDNDPAGRTRLVIFFGTSGNYTNEYSIDQASWQTLSTTGTVPAGATTAYVKLRFYDVSGSFSGTATNYVDNVIYTEDGSSNLVPNGGFENWTVDNTAPVFDASYPKAQLVQDVKFDLAVSMDEPGTVYYLVQDAATAAPDVNTVIAANHTIDVAAASTEYSTTITGLTASTAYKVYVVAQDLLSTPNVQASVTTVDVTTSSAAPSVTLISPAGGETFHAGDSVLIEWNAVNIDSVVFQPMTACVAIPDAKETYKADTTGVKIFLDWDVEPLEYQVIIMDKLNPTTVADTSGVFTITGPDRVSKLSEVRTYENDTVYFTGKAVVSFAQSYRNQKYIQDSTAGILIDDSDGVMSNYSVGDSIMDIVGKVSVYNGITQFVPFRDARYDNSGLVTPVDVSIADFDANIDTYESRLIRITGLNFTDAGTFANGKNYTVTDGTNDLVFRSNFYDVDYIGNPIPDSVASITGLAMEYKGTAQIAARDEADIVRADAAIDSFKLSEAASTVIDDVNHSINIEVKYGSDLSTLTPTIVLSYGATVNPASGTQQAFTEGTPVTYTVTAEDGVTTQDWDVTVTVGANDTQAPSFRTPFPIIKNVGSSSFDIAVQLDEPSVVYYVVDTVTAAGPTISEIMDGNSFNVDADSVTVNETVSGLAPGGEYKVYIIAADKFTTPNVQPDSLVFDVTMNPAVSTTDLIFSEYIEGGSNNKAIEIYNGTGADVDLSGYSVKLAPNGGDWSNVQDLTGTLAAGDVYVIANASADQVILDVADITSTVTYFNGDDALGLFKGADSIDVIGVQGTDPGTAWEVAGVANATQDHTLVRKATVTHGQTDWALSAGTNADDSEWEVYDKDTFSFLGYHGLQVGNNPPEIGYININPANPEATDPVSISTKVVDSDGIVTDVKLMWGTTADTYDNEIAMTDDNNDSVYVTVSDIPAQVAGTTVYLKVVATDDNMASSERTYSYGVPVEASIYEIQFTSADPADSPLKGSRVITGGIVTATIPSTGFFIQDSARAWNGVYVYDFGDNAVNIGDSVAFTALVDEYFDLTELKNLSSFSVVSSDNTVPAPVEITPGEMGEAYEGVLVKLSNLTCTSVATSESYGMWGLSDGTDTIMVDDDMFAFKPTLDSVYTVTGIGYYSYNEFKILPRSADDVIGYVPENQAPVIDNVTITPDAPTTADDVVVAFTVTDDAEILADSIHFYYGTTEGDYANEGTLVPDGFDASKFSVTIPAQNAGTVYFKITAKDSNVEDPKASEYTGNYDVATVGINQLSLDNMISIYPNPSAGHFTLAVEKVVNGKVSVEVTDIQGRMILQKQFNTNNSLKAGIDLGAKGVYFLKVTTGNAFSVQRIVVR